MKGIFTKLMAVLALLLFIAPPMVGWGQENYVVEFASTSTSNDGTQTISALGDIVSNGADYITSIADVSKVYKGKQGYGVKLGSSNGIGSFVMNLSDEGKVEATSLVFNSCRYGTDNSSLKITINGSLTQTFSLTSDLTDYTYTFDNATEITSVKIEGVSKRIYVKSMTVNYETGGGGSTTPSITLVSIDPTVTPESPYMIQYTHISYGGNVDRVQYENFSGELTTTDFYIQYCDAEGNVLESQEAPDWFLEAPSVTSASNNFYLHIEVDVNTVTTPRTCYFKVCANNGNTPVRSALVTVTQAGAPQPVITVTPATVDATAAETSGTLTVAYENVNTDAGVNIDWFADAQGNTSLSEAPNWINASINALNVDYTIAANTGEARTAYFKVHGVDNYSQAVYSDLVTVTQAANPNLLSTMDAIYARAQEVGTTQTSVYVNFGGWVVTGVTANQIFVTDGTKGFYIYQEDSNHGFEVGTALMDVVACTLNLKSNFAAQITGISDSDLTVVSGEPTVATIALSELSGINTGALVRYTGLTYNNGSLTDGTNSIRVTSTLYSGSGLFTNGLTYNVTGVIWGYNDDVEIMPRSAEDIEEVVDYATLPFSWQGGPKADLEALDGVTAYGLGSDYNSNTHSPYLIKLDDTDDYLQVKCNGQPGKVTIGVKMIGGSNTSSITVQGSADGETFTNVETLTISGSQTDILSLETTNAFAATDRYVRLLFTKGSNVGVGPITIAEPVPYIALVNVTSDPEANAYQKEYSAGSQGGNMAGVNYGKFDVSGASSFSIEFCDENGDAIPAYPTWLTCEVVAAYNWWTYSPYVLTVEVEENEGDARTAYFKICAYNGNDPVYSDIISVTQEQPYYLTVGTPNGEAYELGENVEGIYVFYQNSGQDPLIEDGAAGRVRADNGRAIIVSPSAAEGYVISSLSVKDDSGDDVATTYDSDGQYYLFTMPTSDVTIQATAAPKAVYTYSVNGVESQYETVADETIDLAAGEDLNSDFTFAGWTTGPSDVTNILAAGATQTIQGGETFYAVYSRQEEAGTVNCYEKVTSAPSNWAGDYLIAYSDMIFADGRYGGKDSNGIGGEGVSVDLSDYISNDQIPVDNGDTYHVTLEAITEGGNTFVLKTQDGKYNYQTSNANGLATTENKSTAANYPITVTYESENNIKLALGGGAAGAVFRYNTNGYFRFYKDGGQSPVYLFKKVTATQYSNTYYTRVFLNETLTEDTDINGKSVIPSGSVLDASGKNFTNATAANLVIEDGGQIILADDNTGVNARVLKNITGYGEGNGNWYLLSAPTEDGLNANPDYPSDCEVVNLMPADIEDVHMFDLYSFDQTKDAEWQNFRASGVINKAFDKQKGLLYARKESATLEFNVQLLNKPNNNHRMLYEANAEFAGWNLVGNAMMCNQYVSLYQHNACVTTDYYRMNAAGTALELCENGAPVAPMEGFFVQAPSDAQYPVYLHFSSTPLVDNNNAIDLNVTYDNAIVDRARVRFGEGSMLGKFTLNENNTKLYIPQGTKDYAVVRSANEGEMPVSFKAEKSGSYTINVEAENVEMNYLHLIDNLTGTDIDLLATPSYSFEANTRDYANRFKLVFKANTGVEENTATETFAYFNGSEWVINNNGNATLQVVDMMGRVLSSETISGNAEVTLNQAAGVYVLRLIQGNDVKIEKVVVR